MTHIRSTQRAVVLTASAALAAAGALVPAQAFAAPAAAPSASTTSVTAAAPGHSVQGGDRDGYRIRYCHWGKHGRHHGWGNWHCHTYWYDPGKHHWKNQWKDHRKGQWNDNWKGQWNGHWNSGWNGHNDGRLFTRVHGL
ncbi:hypothetical protein ACFRJ1_11415 [Streptomyces sp. NPDC056773]|uniref:hypothetical protein n=1 Tax=unclassified Streptomyces TaxID=2593676 RepID=UPI0036BACA74